MKASIADADWLRARMARVLYLRSVRFTKCIAAVAVAGIALMGSRLAFAEPRPRPIPRRPLATPWPAHVDCADFYGVDVSVDDRVEAVEWRGPEGQSIVVPVAAPSNPELAGERFRKASGALDYFGIWQTSRILFPYRPRPAVSIRAAQGHQLLPRDFKPGLFEAIVVRPRPDAAKLRPAASPAGFGLRLVLHCLDKSKTGLVWACDDRSCGLRSFRDRSSAEPASKWVDGPYRRRWKSGEREVTRARLVCGRTDGYEEAARRARRHDPALVCERPVALADQGAALDEMSRDLLTELDLVLQRGCGGTCSSRIDELRGTIRALLSDPGPLRLRGARARFTPADWEVFEEPATMGWVARLGGVSDGIELACAHYYVESSMSPPAPSCRLTVIAHGARLADYFPDARQEVELPDGGAVHLQGSNTEERDDNFGDHIVIFGSALAIAGDPVTLARLRVLKVEIEYRPFGRLFVRMLAPDDERRVPVSNCRLPAARARATFNGKPLARLTGIFADLDNRTNRDCLLELAFPGPTGPEGTKLAGSVPKSVRSRGPASLRIDEGATHYALEIPDAFSRRALTFVSPADGVMHAGQRVSLRWQPATDDISEVEITLRRTGSDGEEAFVDIGRDALTIRGDQIEFTIPALLPGTFRGKIEILGLPALKPRSGPCPVDDCSVKLIMDWSDITPLPARLE